MRATRTFGLDLLRMIAILLVLHAHTARYVASKAHNAVALGFIGYVGVELFFVLSGFLIGGILIRGLEVADTPLPLQVGRFWARRWLRTLPNYYLAFLAVVACVQWTTGHNILNFPDYQKLWWFGQNLRKPPPALFTVAWSLSVEEWFYLLFPLLAGGMLLLQRPRALRAVATAAGMVALGCLTCRAAAHMGGQASWDSHLRQMVPFRLDGIAIGVLAACVKRAWVADWHRWRRQAAAAGWVVMGLHTLLYFHFGQFKGADGRAWGDTVFFTGFSIGLALLLPACDGWKAAPRLLSWPVGHVAAISYSLYLYHTTWIMVVDRKLRPGVGGWGTWLMAWVGAWLIATMVYYLVERPVLWLRDRWIPDRG